MTETPVPGESSVPDAELVELASIEPFSAAGDSLPPELPDSAPTLSLDTEGAPQTGPQLASKRGPRRKTRLVLVGLITAWTVGTVGFAGIQAPPKPVVALQLDSAKAMGDVLSGQLGSFQDKWFGTPALWTPPAGVEVRFFDVKGTTQSDLISSINAANLCATYKCLPDPGNPSGGAWALQGGGFGAGLCYSPRTASLPIQLYILMPGWLPKPFGQVSSGLIVKWNALEQILYTHEATHAAIAVRDLTAIAGQARLQPSCTAWVAFLSRPSLFDQLDTDQNAFHAQLRADCRPEIGCIPAGYMGW
jgi:hypothetical protein